MVITALVSNNYLIKLCQRREAGISTITSLDMVFTKNGMVQVSGWQVYYDGQPVVGMVFNRGEVAFLPYLIKRVFEVLI